jgi:hypothetical protein
MPLQEDWRLFLICRISRWLVQKAQELIQVIVLDKIYDSLDFISDPRIKFSQPIFKWIIFSFILLQNLSPVRQPDWAQITQIFMDETEASGTHLILYDNNKACGQTKMVGNSGRW